MSLDSQLPEDTFFAMAYKAPSRNQSIRKEKDWSLEEGLFASSLGITGIASLVMGISDVYDCILQERSYHFLQYAETAIELMIGVVFSLAAINRVLEYQDYKNTQRSMQ